MQATNLTVSSGCLPRLQTVPPPPTIHCSNPDKVVKKKKKNRFHPFLDSFGKHVSPGGRYLLLLVLPWGALPVGVITSDWSQDSAVVGERFAPAPPVRFWKTDRKTEAFETEPEQKDCCLWDRKKTKKQKKLWQLCYHDTSKQLEVSSDEGRSGLRK